MLSKTSICALTRTCSVTFKVGSSRRRMSAEVKSLPRQFELLRAAQLGSLVPLAADPAMPVLLNSEIGIGNGARGPVLLS